MSDTIMDVLTATRDIAYHQGGFNAPATKSLDEAIENRRLEVAAIRVTLAEAIFALTPVSAAEALTGLLELQQRYRAIVH